LDGREGRLEAWVASLAQGEIEVVLWGATKGQRGGALLCGGGGTNDAEQGRAEKNKGVAQLATQLHDLSMVEERGADKRRLSSTRLSSTS
jgi:50S ribosomal subunit-associated GTPase HflX